MMPAICIPKRNAAGAGLECRSPDQFVLDRLEYRFDHGVIVAIALCSPSPGLIQYTDQVPANRLDRLLLLNEIGATYLRNRLHNQHPK